MLFVDNRNLTDPALNLALEERVMRHARVPDDLLLVYINEPSIIIGRNQNTLEEINLPFVEQHGVHVVRRLSGGGTVYHDLGNLNFSFITRTAPEFVHNFKKFTAPVIQVLREMGVPAELSGRNDILVEGRKISGNAQYLAAGRLVSHGTLLFDSNLDTVSEALRPRPDKIISKGIKSVRSRVANISEFLPQPMALAEFKQRLLQGIFEGAESIPHYELNEEDWQAIHSLADERYRAWDWNFGQSPEFNLQRTRRFPSGEIDARMDVYHGVIRAIRFFGDFFGQEDVGELEARLVGVRYKREDLATALCSVDTTRYFSGVTCEEFLALLY